MGLPCIVEGRTPGDRNAHSDPDTAGTATIGPGCVPYPVLRNQLICSPPLSVFFAELLWVAKLLSGKRFAGLNCAVKADARRPMLQRLSLPEQMQSALRET